MPGFIAELCAKHKTWAEDGTVFEEEPEGWRALITALFDDLAAIMAEVPGKRLRVVQVKEKFGALRFYRTAGRGRPRPSCRWRRSVRRSSGRKRARH